MTLEGHFCWDDCDEGPHGCICGNDCKPPVYLDPEPYTDGETRRAKPFGAYLPVGQLTSYFAPRPGYSQNKEDYA